MKTRGLFLSALVMGAVWTGCATDEVLESVDSKQMQKSDSYIAVNIVAPGVESRATAGDFEAGEGVENVVNSGLFVFFNENNEFVQAVDVAGAALNPWETGQGSVEKISNAVIVLNNPSSTPKQVVALLNTDLTSETIGTPTLPQLKNKVDNYSSVESFVMSNSVYQDVNGNEMVATQLTDANLQKSEALAKQNPVTISVERVLAKVEAIVSNPTVTGKKVELDGVPGVTLVPEITGFKVVATNPSSYLLKNIDDYDFDWTWNDAANTRSYWATSATPESYGYCTYNEILPVANFAEYCQENTTATTTKLLVSATIKPEGAESAATILKYKGLYYTTDGLLTKVNSMLADYKYTTTNEAGEIVQTNNWAPYLDIVDAGDDSTAEPWEVKVALKSGAPQVAGVSDVISKLDRAAQWTEGKAYFFVDVEHFGGQEVNYGVIRNHLYQLTINSVSGLGTPVYNPQETIIPEKMPEEEYFVAAEVQILKWKIVAQQVALN